MAYKYLQYYRYLRKNFAYSVKNARVSASISSGVYYQTQKYWMRYWRWR